MKTGHNVYCDACHDLIPMDALGGRVGGRDYCDECYAEVEFGIIAGPPVILDFDGPRLRRDPDQAGPWQEHAIRCLEEARAE